MDDVGDAALDAAALVAAKARLRRDRAASRAAMSDAARAAGRAAIRDVVLARAADSAWQCVAAYVPLRTEPGSTALLDGLAGLGVNVLVPITLADRDLDWAVWSPDGLWAPLGRAAVARAEAVLVPAFAVGDDGLRLGRGGGSYDRALPRCAPDAVTAAVLFDGERVTRVPAQPWDRAVRAAVTPSGWEFLPV